MYTNKDLTWWGYDPTGVPPIPSSWLETPYRFPPEFPPSEVDQEKINQIIKKQLESFPKLPPVSINNKWVPDWNDPLYLKELEEFMEKIPFPKLMKEVLEYKPKINNEMEIEYFIPTMEDIRFGYEYKLNLADVSTGRWETNHIKETNLKSIRELIEAKRIRVPYLLPHQVEQNGWKFIKKLPLEKEGRSYNIWEKINEMKACMDCFKYRWTMWIEDITHISHIGESKIIIQQEISGGFAGIHRTSVIFEGTLKSINEFRYISKLLKIN